VSVHSDRGAAACPNCDPCTCPKDERGFPTLDDAFCPMHGVGSRHGTVTLDAGAEWRIGSQADPPPGTG
jgi:hypothetical protein